MSTPPGPQLGYVLEAVRARGGKVSDRALSDETGAHICTIRAYRLMLGIDAYKGRGWETRGAWAWTAEELELPTRALMERTGLTQSHINTVKRQARARRAGQGA